MDYCRDDRSIIHLRRIPGQVPAAGLPISEEGVPAAQTERDVMGERLWAPDGREEEVIRHAAHLHKASAGIVDVGCPGRGSVQPVHLKAAGLYVRKRRQADCVV